MEFVFLPPSLPPSPSLPSSFSASVWSNVTQLTLAHTHSAIYRSWLDYSSDLQYVLLQSTRPNETGVLGITGSSAGTGSRRTSPRHRIGRVRSGYLAEGSSEEN